MAGQSLSGPLATICTFFDLPDFLPEIFAVVNFSLAHKKPIGKENSLKGINGVAFYFKWVSRQIPYSALPFM
jgi:hypothetical protein